MEPPNDGRQTAKSLGRYHAGIDDETTLLDRVRTSGRSVAVYDVSNPAILAASSLAREQLGFVDVELSEVDIVDRARDPESVRRLLALICDGELKEWKVRSWLRTPDGGGSWDFATGHAIDVGSRRFGLVSYPVPYAQLENLSPREIDIVARILRGERVPTIARSLYLSASTVRNHLSSIYRKVGVHSQVELIEALQPAHYPTPPEVQP